MQFSPVFLENSNYYPKYRSFDKPHSPITSDNRGSTVHIIEFQEHSLLLRDFIV